MGLGFEIVVLFVLAIPIAAITWTITHEELFREPREFFLARSRNAPYWHQRKFFYIFTCEYCFSHYVTLFFVGITRYQLLFSGWRGYLIAFFALIWVANLYMSVFGRLRLDLKSTRAEIAQQEQALKTETELVQRLGSRH